MPNIKVIDRYAQLMDVKASEIMAQANVPQRHVRKSDAIILCGLVENFLTEYERQKDGH
jgi:hypothetical protein